MSIEQYTSGLEVDHINHGTKGLPCFVDMKEEMLPKCGDSLTKFMIIFSSPNRARYKAILEIPGSTMHVMPMWTEEEIFRAHAVIKNLMKIPISTIEEQLRISGPVPRHIFEVNRWRKPR